MKAAICTALLVLCAALPGHADAAVKFSDTGSHWAEKEIEYLAERNMIGGFEDGTFKPNAPITRAQASAMLVKALKIPLADSPQTVFKDVSPHSAYYRILATVNEKGIVRGENGYMRPGEKTSRAQMAAILRRAFNMPLDQQATFIDVTEAHWAYQDINGIAKQRTAGGSNGKFMPAEAVTRAQFSAFLVRAMDDSMKLPRYRSYISQKGKIAEWDGMAYTFRKESYNAKLFQLDTAAGKEKVILERGDLPPNDVFHEYMMEGFPVIAYNDELFVNYWLSLGEMTEMPHAFQLYRLKHDGSNPQLMDVGGASLRNVFIWNDRIYYTKEKNQPREFDRSFNPERPVIDDPLVLYSADMNGKGERAELAFTARVVFTALSFTPDHPHVSQDNKSVLFDHSTMYYFNKSGVYKYSLLDQKTVKLSHVLGKDMQVSGRQLIVTDIGGKKHLLKK